MTSKLRIEAIRRQFLAAPRRASKILRNLKHPQAAVVAAGFLTILYFAFSVTVFKQAAPPVRTGYRAPDRVAPEPLKHRSRKVYPYSVVPGGIYDATEVKARMKSDPVVFAHYQGVKADKLKPVQLAKPRLAYVSYRKGDRIYWTKRPVKIAAGETVWTDGKSKIRARCGNMLAENPQLPTYWMDPPEEKLNQADAKLLILPVRAAVSTVRSPILGELPTVDDQGNPLFAPIEEVGTWFPEAVIEGTGPAFAGGIQLGPGGPGGPGGPIDPGGPGNPGGPGDPGDPGDPGNPPVTPPGPNPPGPNPPNPEPPGPNPPGPNPPGPNPPGPNPPGPNPPPVTPPGPNPPGPNPPGPNPPGPNPPGPNPPGPNPPTDPPVNPPPQFPPLPPVTPPGPNPPPNPPGPPTDPPGPPTDPPVDPPPVTPVPEPSTYLMMGAGLAAMAYLRKRRGTR